MKTVLVITSVPAHTALYGEGLRQFFKVHFSPRATGGSGRVDAIVYDIPTQHSTIDLRWLARVKIPVVVLTPEDSLRLPEAPRRRVLTYPVRPRQIIEALAAMGVKPEGGGLVR